MDPTLSVASSVIQSLETQVDVVGDNIANVDTTGFQSARANLADGDSRGFGAGDAAAAKIIVSSGSVVASTNRVTDQGPLLETGSPTDLAIDGQGYFVVRRADGTIAYTRNGSFSLDGDRRLVTGTGEIVQPPITVPVGSSLSISPTGAVTAVDPNGNDTTLGQLQLATFPNTDALVRAGDSLLTANAASGPAQLSTPGQNGTGEIRQGALEGSNVDLATQFVSLIDGQSAISMLANLINSTSQMTQEANSLGQ